VFEMNSVLASVASWAGPGCGRGEKTEKKRKWPRPGFSIYKFFSIFQISLNTKQFEF
jgi:hypothetical protein